jgi:predicted MPP superfamily phosphohydrolase
MFNFGRMFVLFIDYLLWPALFVAWRMYYLFKPKLKKIPKSKAKKKVSITKNTMPTTFAHITDLHFIITREEHIQHIKDMFDKIASDIKPDAIVLSGDIVDGRRGDSKFSVYGQYLVNWIPFQEILEYHQDMKFITVAGNHDEVNIQDNNDKDHYFNLTNRTNSDEFYVQSHIIETNAGKVRIVAFNPFSFPYPPSPLGIFLNPTDELLEKLTDALNGTEEVIFNIVVTHNPSESMINQENYEKAISRDNSVRLVLAGHYHVEAPFYHILENGTIEAIGSWNEGESSTISVLSVDGGVTALSPVDLGETLFVVTNPPPAEQFTDQNYYNEGEFRIRVCVFGTQKMRISVFIDGEPIGTMEEDFSENGKTVYGLDAHCEQKGKHQLMFMGDISHTQTFIIGPETEEMESKGLGYYMRVRPLTILTISFEIFVLCILFLPFILDAIPACRSLMHNYTQWVFHDGTFNTGSAFVDYIVAIFAGPLYMLWRFSQCTLRMKLNVFLCHFLHYFVPFFLYFGEKYFTVVGFWFIMYNTKFVLDPSTFISECIHLIAVLFPMFIVASAVSDGSTWEGSIYLIVVIGCIPLAIGIWAIYALSNMADGLLSVFTSPKLYVQIIHLTVLAIDIYASTKVSSK